MRERGGARGWLSADGERDREQQVASRIRGCQRGRTRKSDSRRPCNWSPYDNLNYQSGLTAAIPPARFNFRGLFPSWSPLPPVAPGTWSDRSRDIGIIRIPYPFEATPLLNISIFHRTETRRRAIKKWWNSWATCRGAHDRGKIIIGRNWIHRPLCPRAYVEFFRTRPNYPAKSYYLSRRRPRVFFSAAWPRVYYLQGSLCKPLIGSKRSICLDSIWEPS